MVEYSIRNATVDDIPFLIDTIIEAEKSGTNVLSYNTIFGLSETEVRIYIMKMLVEEVDDCELSISSFKVVFDNEIPIGAISAWIEGYNGIPSVILKGNLLNYVLPKECIDRAKVFYPIIKQIHIDNKQNTIQLGLVYIIEEYRGKGMVKYLLDNYIYSLSRTLENINSIYVQVYSNNISAINSYMKYGFELVESKKTDDKSIVNLLPCNEKYLLRKTIKQ